MDIVEAELYAVDMLPGRAHVEAVVKLERQ